MKLLVFLVFVFLVCGDLPPIDLELIETISRKNATAGPSQVHISYAGKDQVLVQWVSTSEKDPSQVNYGTSASSLTMSATGNAVSYSFEGYTSGGIHYVLLPALNTSTTYYYQVGGPGQWSTTYNFKSAPVVGKDNIFIGTMGDVGADSNSELTIKGLMDVRDKIGLDLILHAGDLSYANNYNPGGPVWDHYGEILEPLASKTLYNPSVGNHETIDDFTGFKIRYGVEILENNSAGGDFYWSVDFGFVHVIMLSSETDYAPTSDQHKWLEADLAAVNRQMTPWVLAVWHRPWYCSNHAHQGEGEKMRASFEPLFDKYNVDLGITGHVHAYERVDEVLDYKVTPGKTAYIVNGNGGTPEGLASTWEAQPAWSKFRVSKWGYGSLQLVNATHGHWMMFSDTNGAVMDETWFVRKYPR